MPNIYIRLPISRCQFFRNRDTKHPLLPWQPLKFSDYSEEMQVIRSSIYNKVLNLNSSTDGRFFSSQEWKNLMRGKDTLGKEQRLKRNASDWLQYDEIVQLMGFKSSAKSSLFDYLCIKLPTEVFCIDDVRPVTPTWCIDAHGYNRLYELLNNDFKRTVVDWALATFDFATSNGQLVLRAQQSMLERFLIHYNINATEDEKDNLRRVIDRWLRAEHSNFTSYSSFSMQYDDTIERRLTVKGVEWR